MVFERFVIILGVGGRRKNGKAEKGMERGQCMQFLLSVVEEA
jgi:hypothetical protein